MTETNSKKPEETILAADNEAVIKHMEMYQGIITRMAGNSAACKTWGIPLIAAILGFVLEGANRNLALLAMLTVPVLYFLDSYYLMLENRFRDGFDDSAKKIQAGIFTQSDLYNLRPMGTEWEHWKKAIKSYATSVVYIGLFLLVLFGYYTVAS